MPECSRGSDKFFDMCYRQNQKQFLQAIEPAIILQGQPPSEGILAVVFIVVNSEVALGTVKWFNATEGYGFIAPDEGGPDVFVHISAVQKAGYSELLEGARVSYEAKVGRSGKTSTEDLRIG